MGNICTSRGFTLVEMLVVLLIVGMASSLLFEGSAQVMAMQARFNGQLERLRGESLRADWLRQVVQGLQPDYPDGAHTFKGSARGFSGLTTNPLSTSYGGLAAFAVELQRDTLHHEMVLRYGNNKGAPELLRWKGDQALLRYVDATGEAHDAWPPPLGQSPQLPAAIYLEGGTDTGKVVVIASPNGPTAPIQRARDFFKGVAGGPS